MKVSLVLFFFMSPVIAATVYLALPSADEERWEAEMKEDYCYSYMREAELKVRALRIGTHINMYRTQSAVWYDYDVHETFPTYRYHAALREGWKIKTPEGFYCPYQAPPHGIDL